MPQSFTPRGFAMYADFDHRTYPDASIQRLTVQQSSLAFEHKVWVGLDEQRAHLSVEEARIVRDALTEFIEADPDAEA